MIPTLEKKDIYWADEEIPISATLTSSIDFLCDERPAIVSLYNNELEYSVSFEIGLKDGVATILIQPGEIPPGDYKIVVRHKQTKIQSTFTVRARHSG